MSIRNGQIMQIIKIKKKTFSLIFNQPRCHGNYPRLSQNARMYPSVVKCDSCNKTGAKAWID